MRVFLVRHTAVDVEPGTCYGQSDVPLKESFESEAAIVKAKLEILVAQGVKFDTIYTSPLSRCVKLATYCGYPNAQREASIKEINFGEWELKKFSDITDPRLQEWYDNYLEVRATGGESFRDQYERVAAFLSELGSSAADSESCLSESSSSEPCSSESMLSASCSSAPFSSLPSVSEPMLLESCSLGFMPSRTALLFTHGGVIGCARVFSKELAPDEVFLNLTDYGGVVEIEV